MKKLTLFLLALTLSLSFNTRADEAQKRELRTVWVATVSNIDWPQTRGTSATVIAKQKQQLINLLNGFKKANMNGICLQVRPMADALYKSSYEPWSSYVSGTRGVDPGWDPLAFAVEECHKRGMECHAWVNPYRFSNSGGRDCTTSIDQAIKNSGMLMQVGDRIVFNPALEESRQHVINVCKEMIQNYDIDGIIFDDYFYPGGGTPEDSSAPDYQLWQQSNSGMSIADWRRANVNLMVQQFYDMVQETKPYVKFGIGPAGVAGTRSTSAAKHGVDPCPTGSDWQYSQIYSDPLAWLEEGTIDYISPQLYWKTTHSTNPFGPLTQWWSYVANHFGRHHYASHNIYFMESTNSLDDWKEICKQIQYSRDYNLDNAPGVNFYSAKYIDGPKCSGLADYLASTLFTHEAIPPAMTWKNKTNYDAPSNLALNGNTLSWTAFDAHLMKYAVYAIPQTVAPEDAKSTKFDGIKSDYLLGLTYEPQWTLDSDHQNGYYYAVCAVDGWCNEFDPAYVNLPNGYAEKVTLISPVGGANATWSQNFTWTAAEGATYRIQIAGDAAFANIVVQQNAITTNQVTLDLSDLESGKTYYWRVYCSQPSRIDNKSDVATFKAPTREPAPVATLVAPDNGASFDDNFNFVFNKVNGVDRHELQVATDQAFTNIVYNTTNFSGNTSLSHQMIVSLLGKGTYYWRVVTGGSHYLDAASEVRRFVINSVPIGQTEPGYVMKRDIDNDNYSIINGLKLNNLWIRSTMSQYGNFSFVDDGLMNRGFAVKGNRIYQAGRSEGATNADTYLRVYDAATGERVKDINLPEDTHVSYYPVNDVLVDDGGNILVTNLLLNVTSAPLVIHKVNEQTGEATRVATLTATNVTSKPRIDHCNVLGDVNTGNFMVFAATASGTEIIRWTIKNGILTQTLVTKVKGFAPSSAEHFGIAPRIYPLSESSVLITGGNIYVTRYNVNTGNIEDQFSSSSPLVSSDTQSNGAAMFDFMGKHFLMMAYGDHNSAAGYRFVLAKNDTGESFSGMNLLWTLPEQGIGDTYSGTWSAPCIARQSDDPRTMNLYVYVPGCGIAAYELKSVRGDVNGDGTVDARDVTEIIGMILGQLPNNLETADISNDGNIDVTDVTALVNIILGIEF